MKKRIASLILAICLCLVLLPAAAKAATTVSTSAVSDLADVATSLKGKTASQLGLATTNWCGYFVGYCINHSDIGDALGTISNSQCANGMVLANWACKTKDAAVFYSYSSAHVDRLKEAYNLSDSQIVLTSPSAFTPQAGDIVEFSYQDWSAHNFRHVGIVTGFDGSKVTWVDGNNSSDGTVSQHSMKQTTSGADETLTIFGYIRFRTNSVHSLTINFNANGGTVNSDRFSMASDGTIMDGSVKASNVWEYGTGSPDYGLWNAGSFGLTRSGCSFVGWSGSPNNSSPLYDQDDKTLTSNRMAYGLENQDITITLYAFWVTNDYTTIPDGVYTINSAEAYLKRCFGVNASTGNIELQEKDGSAAQQFEFVYLGNNCYKIIAKGSGQVLTVENGSTVSYANVRQSQDNGANSQKWLLTDVGDGYWIRPYVNTGMTLTQGEGYENYNIETNMIRGWDTQEWVLEPVTQTTTPSTPTTPPTTGTTIPEVHFPQQTIYFQGQFTDVPEKQWYTDSVAAAFEFGLMRGDSDTTFNPYGDVTVAEAITMAARIHSIYYTGTENFVQSGKWWQCYLDYAYENGIISYAYYNCDVTQKASRAQFAEIFANALPDEGLWPVNSVADGAIPDMPMTSRYAAAVYRLYRAGILIGSDANGNFYPDTYIRRCEAAAIVSRMAESSNRQSITLG